ncbi:MAG: sulfurtransferase [Geobacter sp.]|nr:MAG: sulfurtransferase [Geobacter sp.]
MAITDYFRKIASRSADDVRKIIDTMDPDEFSLVDVRQPDEYKQGHLPGAKLIPLGELPDRLEELDPNKPTLVYCAAGVRSRAGASILTRAGFAAAYSMEGGIRAWNGLVVEELPATGMAWFLSAQSAEELIGLAWLLEDGMRSFYLEIAKGLDRSEEAQLFMELAGAELHHKNALQKLYQHQSGKDPGVNSPADVLSNKPKEKYLEGGVLLSEAFSWAGKKDAGEILEFAMSLEVGSYDRYLSLREYFKDESSREVFGLLAAEEKAHLKRLTRLFEKSMSDTGSN